MKKIDLKKGDIPEIMETQYCNKCNSRKERWYLQSPEKILYSFCGHCEDVAASMANVLVEHLDSLLRRKLMYKTLLFPIILVSSYSVEALPSPKELTVQQLINALSYIKHENKELSEILPELHQEALDALDESYPFKAIDILIRALQYALERICSFNDNFDVHLYTAHLNLPETILTPIDMDLVRTPLTPANMEIDKK